MSGELRRRAMPGRPLQSVSLQTRLLDRTLDAPLLVPAGGTIRSSDRAIRLALLGPADVTPWNAADRIDEFDAEGVCIELDPLVQPLEADAIVAVVHHVAPRAVVVLGATDFEDYSALHGAGVAAIGVPGNADAITSARVAAPGVPLIAEVRDGAHLAVCIALGATAGRLAEGESDGAVRELRCATWLAGAASVQELTADHLR